MTINELIENLQKLSEEERQSQMCGILYSNFPSECYLDKISIDAGWESVDIIIKKY